MWHDTITPSGNFQLGSDTSSYFNLASSTYELGDNTHPNPGNRVTISDALLTFLHCKTDTKEIAKGSHFHSLMDGDSYIIIMAIHF